MLAAHLFEECQPCSEEAGVAIHAVEWKGPKLLPALRAVFGGERFAALAGTPGLDATGSTLGTRPKTGAVTTGTILALVPEAPGQFAITDLRIAVCNEDVMVYHFDHRTS